MRRACSVAVALLLASHAGCDESRAPSSGAAAAETTSPADSPVAYRVLKDETSNGTVDFHVLVAENTRREAVDALLKYLYRHLVTRHDDPPAGVAAYVYTSEAAFSTPPRTPAGTLTKKPSDLGPSFENRVPLDFAAQIAEALGPPSNPGWKLQRKVVRDDAAHTLALTLPYTEPGKDQWAEALSFNQAMQGFTDAAQALFGNVPELRALTFSGVWKDKEVVHVALGRPDYSELKLSEIDERIGSHHGRIFLQLQTGKEAHLDAAKANVSAGRQNAALVAHEYRAMLAQLRGKATVSPALK